MQKKKKNSHLHCMQCLIWLFVGSQLTIGPKGECPTMKGSSRISLFSKWPKMSWRWRSRPSCCSPLTASWLQVCSRPTHGVPDQMCDVAFLFECWFESVLQKWSLSDRVTCQTRSCCVSSNTPALCRSSSSTPSANLILSTTSIKETSQLTISSWFCR